MPHLTSSYSFARIYHATLSKMHLIECQTAEGIMQRDGLGPRGQKIFTVSQITDKIKAMLENSFSFIWITGEITNVSSPMSGHLYFSLKDENAQISAVMFKGQNRRLTFEPTDGMAVVGLGRINVYKPRGTYQIIFEYLEPKGIGALQVAFEQLKAKLADEGLFDQSRKKPLPFLPQKIALITSPTGAVLQDMLNIARRRFENIRFVLVPVSVQGIGAIQDIVQAIDLVNRHGADVAIVARGGGSLEDLQAFNSEAVARAIAASVVPIVSAVGHETDYTIADFVADYRAPTPSTAAEIVVPEKGFLKKQSESMKKTILLKIISHVHKKNSEINYLSRRLIDPKKKIEDFRLRCDDITAQLNRVFNGLIRRHREILVLRLKLLQKVSPKVRLYAFARQLDHVKSRLKNAIGRIIQTQNFKHNLLDASLRTLNPLAVLDRGYSITRTIPSKKVVRSYKQVDYGQPLEILLVDGSLEVVVNQKNGLRERSEPCQPRHLKPH